MKTLLSIGVIIIIAVVAFVVLSKKSSEQTVPTVSVSATASGQVSPVAISFLNPKKSAHYESNTPAHGANLAGVPINVVIDFNFDLAKPSEIKIMKDGTDFGVGETLIDTNKLAMRRTMSASAPDGLYRVEYTACWPDKSCHTGYFQFAIDRSLATGFTDMTGKSEVTIRLSDIKFMPAQVRVSKGAKVTWINDEDVEHYVNTNSHPAHTYYPSQNSTALKKGQSFSLTFDKGGIYPYHCSAHASSMKDTLLVE